MGEVEEGMEGINGDGRRLGVVNTQDDIQMVYYKIIYLKTI